MPYLDLFMMNTSTLLKLFFFACELYNRNTKAGIGREHGVIWLTFLPCAFKSSITVIV